MEKVTRTLAVEDRKNPAKVLDFVVAVVTDQLGNDKVEINKDTAFIKDLVADSLDTVELVMEFEFVLNISIPDEEAEKLMTVGLVVDYILRLDTPASGTIPTPTPSPTVS